MDRATLLAKSVNMSPSNCINNVRQILLVLAVVAFAAAFHSPSSSLTSPKRTPGGAVLHSSFTTTIDINSARDISLLTDWGASWGIQISDCFQLYSEDGVDVFAITNQDLSEGAPILCIPNEIILTGSKAREELGSDSYAAEQSLMNSVEGSDRISQFYLFLKVLKEYELGENSAWFTWLNSLPRYFTNGASMTYFCFGCLPPYAAELSEAEKTHFRQFVQALEYVPFLSEESKSNPDLTKWAYSVVLTRCFQMPTGEYCVVPMADYFNHGGVESDVYISYDEEGNCYAYSSQYVSSGQPLRICYGDPTNPSKLLAQFGFLDESSPATFCKYIIKDPSQEIMNMGYDHSQMLFYNNGDISQEVWDVVLYEQLGKGSPDQQQAFYQAHMMGDEATKHNYHSEHFLQTHTALKAHVDFLVNELDELEVGLETQMNQGQDAELHPRLPLIIAHNTFVGKTLDAVQQNLDKMA